MIRNAILIFQIAKAAEVAYSRGTTYSFGSAESDKDLLVR
jgi:hypothetical protein